MITLILIRHGNTFEASQEPRFVGTRTDIPLTEFGREQAGNSARYLMANNLIPAVIIHGPLLRQKQTAEIIADNLSVKNIIQTAELQEIDYGLWENLTAGEIKNKWPEQFSKWNDRGIWQDDIFGTDEKVLIESIIAWLDKIGSDFSDSTILAVTSNGVLRTINKIINKDAYDFKNSKVSTGGICIISYENLNNAAIKSWNIRAVS